LNWRERPCIYSRPRGASRARHVTPRPRGGFMIEIVCPGCGQRLLVKDERVRGRRARCLCKGCNAPLLIDARQVPFGVMIGEVFAPPPRGPAPPASAGRLIAARGAGTLRPVAISGDGAESRGAPVGSSPQEDAPVRRSPERGRGIRLLGRAALVVAIAAAY